MGWGSYRAICVNIALMATSAFAGDCVVKSRDEVLARIPVVEKYITSLMASSDIKGASLALFKGPEILFEKRFGDGEKQPLFQAASISKPVAAFISLKMVQAGDLTLDENMRRFVTKPYLPAQPFDDLVTLRTLLNHTSGMNNDVTGVDRKIYFKPGTQTFYSGAGYLYLQQAMEDIAKKDFVSLSNSPLKDLGMTESTFDLLYEGEKYVGAPYSLVTTPRDLSHFMNELVNPRADNAAVVAQMTTPSFPVDDETQRGLGIQIERCGDEAKFIHHGSNFALHRSVALVYAKSQIGAVVMMRGSATSGIPSAVAQLALGGN